MAGGKKAVVLLSGGLDSATTLAIAIEQGFAIYALSFAYGQRHRHELQAAERVAASLHVAAHKVIRLDAGAFGGSALTGDLPVPRDRSRDEMGHGIPVTYVPARNTIFLSFALAYAEVHHIADIFVGVNAVDYSGYPDCRDEYIRAYENMANLATRDAVTGLLRYTIHTPLIKLSKAAIIRKGLALGLDYGMTHSCYNPDAAGHACGRCDACLIRRAGFLEAGVHDPTVYASSTLGHG